MPSMNEVLAIILGGGRGTRLYPLTRLRAKPAVPMAGKYRLIDIPISNCINSNIYRIAVLTQFNSVSLHRHIAQTYNFDVFHTGWVQIWAAGQTTINQDWYQGTADAVRKQLFEIMSTRARYVLILAGDHLYRMDYTAMADFHWRTDADITVAVKPVSRDDASRFGVLKRDDTFRITDFAEKPKTAEAQDAMVSRDDPDRPFLGSMGIYMFKTEVLVDLLQSYPFDDFGGHLIPHAIKSHHVYGYDFDGYWEDIGTIWSFYETNLALARPDPPFNLFDPNAPIYSRPRSLPGSMIANSQLKNVLVSDGCCISEAVIENTVIGIRSQIHEGVQLTNTILMGNDYYEGEYPSMADIPMGIGKGCRIDGAIIDKNAHVGAGVTIRPYPRGTEIDNDHWAVRDGIVVIPKDEVIPAGTYLGP